MVTENTIVDDRCYHLFTLLFVSVTKSAIEQLLSSMFKPTCNLKIVQNLLLKKFKANLLEVLTETHHY